MKRILVILIMFSSIIHGKEDCSPSAIGIDIQSNIAEKLFYTGTCHYRNKDYKEAVEQWEKLSSLKNIPTEYKELKVDVLNNLGYMKFFGFGTEMHQKQAIEFWKEAILMGHYESEYHLCHAYADIEQSTFDKAKALKHCEKAFLIYKGMESPDEETLKSIKYYLNLVKK